MRCHRSLTAALALGAFLLALPGYALDLTGTWTGSHTCKVFVLGTKDVIPPDPSTIEISQNGSDVTLRVDGTDLYRGFAMPGATKPDQGHLYMVSCGTNDVPGGFDETGDVVVKTKPTGGTFKGLTVFMDDTPEIGTCKWTYKRVDTADPGVPSCP